MITADMRAQMRRLVLAEGWLIETVARRFGVHHSVVRRALRDTPGSPGPTPRPSRLDAHKDYIVKRLTELPDLTAARLMLELRDRGAQIGYSSVKRYVAPVAGTWTSTQVANVAYGAYPTIAVDAAGTIHIVFVTGSGAAPGLSHAFRAAGANGWTVEVIDTNGGRGTIAVDGNGTPHVAYTTSAETIYAVRGSNGVWTKTFLSWSTDLEGFAIGPGNTINVSVVYNAAEILYHNVPQDHWTTVIYGGSAASGHVAGTAARSVAVDASGLVHIVYMEIGNAKTHVYRCFP